MIVPNLPTSKFKDVKFDYVIVGSGAGGAPLAAQLADCGHSVLVLEAGPDHSKLPATSPAREISEVPVLHAPSTEHPDLSWKFFVDHYTRPELLDPKRNEEGKLFYPRATGIGGCTIHNALITVAGPAADWDQLAWLLNDPSWAADVMRGYFQRLELCEYHEARPRRLRSGWARFAETFWWLLGKDDDPTVGRHGFKGWLHTSVVDLKIGLGDSQLLNMLEAAAVYSWKQGMESPTKLVHQVLRGEVSEELDPNHFRRQTERPEGLALIPTAVVGPKTQSKEPRGHRSCAAKRLLAASDKHGERLVIATDCLASRVILEKIDGAFRATGVAYRHGSRLYAAVPEPRGTEFTEGEARANPKGEVILCGGAFNTPQLLMLSGIGPADHLREHGIECKIDSPGVGSNLQDRYEVTVISKMKRSFSVLEGGVFALPADGAAPDKMLAEWRASGTGLYASNGAVLGIFKRSRPDLAQPDLFIFGIPLKFKGYQEGYSVVDPREFDLFTWAILKGHTNNHGGTVRLKSSDPAAVPEINFKYFGCDQPDARDPDLEALLAGVRFVRGIADHSGDVTDEYHPGRKEFGADDEVRKWIKRDAWGHHACGTCRMGRPTDRMAVINSRFRVFGPIDPMQPRAYRKTIGGLRVVDASIFPDIPGYFIVNNLYMAAEKAADVIHGDAT